MIQLIVKLQNRGNFIISWFLKDRKSSDLYEKFLKPNKSHTNRFVQIVQCKTALFQLEEDLYRRIYKRENNVSKRSVVIEGRSDI